MSQSLQGINTSQHFFPRILAIYEPTTFFLVKQLNRIQYLLPGRGQGAGAIPGSLELQVGWLLGEGRGEADRICSFLGYQRVSQILGIHTHTAHLPPLPGMGQEGDFVPRKLSLRLESQADERPQPGVVRKPSPSLGAKRCSGPAQVPRCPGGGFQGKEAFLQEAVSLLFPERGQERMETLRPQ